MPGLFHHLLRFLFRLGYFGPFLLGIFDSSFLFLPFGNDLLVVALTARKHDGYLLYVLSAACGSTLGVVLLDWVARKLGETGVTRIAGQKRFEYLKRKIERYGGNMIAVGCLAPPPFPFTMAVAVNSALGYPRGRLFTIVAICRTIRFLILGGLALKFGRVIIHVINSTGFKVFMYSFTLLCLAGSAASLAQWIRRGRSPRSPNPAQQPA